MALVRPAALPCSLLALTLLTTAHAAPVCSARSAATVTPVVELYTSEGCNSCPPADRWLSTVKADAPFVALAFHVDYWDRLGWTDRFASPAYTQRQTEQQRSSGTRFSYTPQVIIDGADRQDWPRASVTSPTRAPATVAAQLVRDGHRVTATVTPGAGAPARLAAYWAVTEQAHVSAVKSGENQGVTLHHDFVVRDYRPVAAWAMRPEPTSLQLDLHADADPAHPRLVNLVIVDAATGRPVQAVKLGC